MNKGRLEAFTVAIVQGRSDYDEGNSGLILS